MFLQRLPREILQLHAAGNQAAHVIGEFRSLQSSGKRLVPVVDGLHMKFPFWEFRKFPHIADALLILQNVRADGKTVISLIGIFGINNLLHDSSFPSSTRKELENSGNRSLSIRVSNTLASSKS